MFLKEKSSRHMVEVIDVEELFDPKLTAIRGKYNIGEADQFEQEFAKAGLVFLSDEALPKCWVDPHAA